MIINVVANGYHPLIRVIDAATELFSRIGCIFASHAAGTLCFTGSD
jgi:hypothetical protein